MRVLEVLAVGPQATVQDLGRTGMFRFGVGVSGAADPAALRTGNRLLGNAEGAAGIEVLLGGLTVRALADLQVAITGARCPVTVDGVPQGHAARVRLRAGRVLRLGPATAGLRAYLTVRGGIDVPAVLGSRSTDTLAGLGPAPLAAGDALAVGPAPSGWPAADFVPLPAPSRAPTTVRASTGPRADFFADPTVLWRGSWEVTADTDRVGVRLRRADGPPLRRAHDRELVSEGMPTGAIQVPPSGEPVVFLADHPITGGYPVIAVVDAADIGRVAQARPGERLRFRA